MSYTSNTLKLDCRNAYNPWTRVEETILLTLMKQGKSIKQIAIELGRSEHAIEMRLERIAEHRHNKEVNTQAKMETNMSKVNLLVDMLQEDEMQTIHVTFDSAKKYMYKTRDMSIKVDDYVVVCARDTYQVVKVVEVDGFNNSGSANMDIKEIVQKVDIENYEARVKEEEHMRTVVKKHLAKVEKEKQVAKLKEDMGEDLFNNLVETVKKT